MKSTPSVRNDAILRCLFKDTQNKLLLVSPKGKQGLTSYQRHYRSYQGQVFTGQMTQPTVSKH